METMIALALSVVVTAAMVVLMANSLGTATRVIHMTQLTDELRNAMSMMTRDVRRANYSAYSIFCYGNSDCGAEDGIAEQASDIEVTQLDAVSSCFLYTLDRGFDGNAANDARGGFRRESPGGIGVIEMWTGPADVTPPNCNSAAGTDGWIQVTDPRIVNITEFLVNDAASITKEFIESETSSFTNRQRQLQIELEGRLVLEEGMVTVGAMADTIVRRRIENIIFVRNDFITL